LTVGELVRPDTGREKARLKLVRRASGEPQCTASASHDGLAAFSPVGSAAGAETPERLISPPDTAISRLLQDQTRIVLATLTPLEQLVLRMRFGIAHPGAAAVDDASTALAPEQISFIEATALRKLRHPNRSAHPGSIDC
jgi:hypothetical protein